MILIITQHILKMCCWREHWHANTYLIWIWSSNTNRIQQILQPMRYCPKIQSHFSRYKSVCVIKHVYISPSQWTVLLKEIKIWFFSVMCSKSGEITFSPQSKQLHSQISWKQIVEAVPYFSMNDYHSSHFAEWYQNTCKHLLTFSPHQNNSNWWRDFSLPQTFYQGL